MNPLTRFVLPASAALLLSADPALAQDPPPPEPPPAAAPETPAPGTQALATTEAAPKPKSWYESVAVGGFVDVYFSGNFDGPSNRQNAQTLFNMRANEFSLAVAELNFTKKAEPVGFRLDLQYGPLTEAFHAAEPAAPAHGYEAIKHIQQAYASWSPIENLTLDLGKFVTGAGNELTESQDNWNYSRSYTYYSGPFYHTGLRGSYVLDKLTLMLSVVNGYNNVVDNNDGKTFHVGAYYNSEAFDALFNWIGGPEQLHEDGNWRHLLDGAIKLKPSKSFAAQLYAMYIREDFGPMGSATWWGINGLARLAIGDTGAAALRVEYFDDDGPGTLVTGGQQVLAATVTGEAKVADALLLRLEFRHDHVLGPSDPPPEPFFTSEGGTSEMISTLTLSAVAMF